MIDNENHEKKYNDHSTLKLINCEINNGVYDYYFILKSQKAELQRDIESYIELFK